VERNNIENNNNNLVEVINLKKYFSVGKKKLKAVDDVSLSIKRGETLGLVGESGCGKSTLGRTIVRIYEPDGGKIFYDGKDITRIKTRKEHLDFCKKAQIIFQDPYASLDPYMTVGQIISEGFEIHNMYKENGARKEKVHELLRLVGLNDEHSNRFPHEFSGGQRQRISIARALAINPEFIVCDEPISALDVSIQSQIINLMNELKEKMRLAYLFISHDLNAVRYVSDRIAVMYLGSLMEVAESDTLYNQPRHPYTQALMSAVPVPDPKKEREKERILLEGDVPSPIDVPPGCPFSTRCPYAEAICLKEKPELRDLGDGHHIACHMAG
jgi:oligopeptide transport system ATP-binding protein